MAYKDKQTDYLKRQNGEGSYSPYNFIYHYLMDNFEPSQDLSGIGEVLTEQYKEYCIKHGITLNDESMRNDIKMAVDNFKTNNGKHGDTAHNLGKAQSNSVNTIARTLQDLKW